MTNLDMDIQQELPTDALNNGEPKVELSEKILEDFMLKYKPGSVRKYEKPTKLIDSGNHLYGKPRLELAVVVRDVMLEIQNSTPSGVQMKVFLDGGTLVGTWRSGKLLPHDDDFDFAVYFPQFTMSNLIWLQEQLETRLVGTGFKVRPVTSYCLKLEVYDPSHGKYIVPGTSYFGADYHHVTCDIQTCTDDAEDNNIVRMLHMLNMHTPIPKCCMESCPEMSLEGESFPCPAQPEVYLTAIYGHLGTDHVYNETLGIYVKTNDRSEA